MARRPPAGHFTPAPPRGTASVSRTAQAAPQPAKPCRGCGAKDVRRVIRAPEQPDPEFERELRARREGQ